MAAWPHDDTASKNAFYGDFHSSGWQGAGDTKTNTFKILGPMAGLTFSKGAPGGPQAGLMYNVLARQRYELSNAMPGIRRQIQSGDVDGAREVLSGLNVPPRLQNYFIVTTQDPSRRMSRRAMKNFMQYGTDEEKAIMQHYSDRQP